MTRRLVRIGTGNQGEAWRRDFLPPNAADGTVEVGAAVDVNEDALGNAVEHLDPPVERCYTDAETAMTDGRRTRSRRWSARGWSTSRRTTRGATHG